MTSGHSVTGWIEDLKEGDSAAMQAIWDRFAPELLRVARNRLQGMKSRDADEDDVVLSAMNKLFVGAKQGRFPNLADRDSLWRLLLYMTGCKAWDVRRRENSQKRGGGKVYASLDDSSGPGNFDLEMAVSNLATPEFATMVIEEYERLLAALKDDRYRKLAVAKMEGYTNKEIAQQFGCSERTIERELRSIRDRWSQEGLP
jgi:RNA polymerase sigma factor (sigma-70 family)